MNKNFPKKTLVTLFAESNDNTGFVHGETESSNYYNNGLFRYEVVADCFKIVNNPENDLPDLRTENLGNISELVRYYSKNYAKYFILAGHKKELRVSKMSFKRVEDACEYLKDRAGKWFILGHSSCRMFPKKENTDPFTTSCHEKNTCFIRDFPSGNIYGPFLNSDYEVYTWTCFNFGSGYYALSVLERCNLVDGTPRNKIEPSVPKWDNQKIGDFLIFEKYSDESVELVLVTASIKVAEAKTKEKNGCFLITKWLYSIDMH